MTTGALEAISTDLVRGIYRRRRRVHRVRRAAGTAALAAWALAASFAVFGTSDDNNALAVSRDADVIELRIVDADANAAEMNDDLRAAGLDVRVQLVPTPPAQVGTWLGIQTNASGNRTVDDSNIRQLRQRAPGYEVHVAGSVVELPRGFRGRGVILLAGRAPHAGEQPVGAERER